MTRKKIKDLVMMGVCLALIVVCSKISVPVGIVPMTLQTFAVFICSLILGWKASIVLVLYTILGLIGLPVFSSGGGFAYVYAPSFGFIIGFIPASVVIGIANNKEVIYLKYITSLIGLIIIYLVGVIYMYLIYKYYMGATKDFVTIIQIAVLPFIIKDILVMVASCLIYSRIKVIMID